MVADQLKLSSEERHSSLWRKLEQLLERRLDSCRKQNDGLSLDPTQTAVIRGRISEVKHLRNLLAMDASPAQAVDGE